MYIIGHTLIQRHTHVHERTFTYMYVHTLYNIQVTKCAFYTCMYVHHTPTLANVQFQKSHVQAIFSTTFPHPRGGVDWSMNIVQCATKEKDHVISNRQSASCTRRQVDLGRQIRTRFLPPLLSSLLSSQLLLHSLWSPEHEYRMIRQAHERAPPLFLQY